MTPSPLIVTIAGWPGAGKTTLAKTLSQRFGIPWYSMGDLRGKMAQERGMTIDELNELGQRDPSTDLDVDAYQRSLGEKGESFIVDSWMGWHFLPQSFKLFLQVDPSVAGQRVFEARRHESQPDEPTYLSPEEAWQTLQARVENSRGRYLKYYQQDFLDLSHYDAVLDTTGREAEETAQKAESLVRAWLAARETRSVPAH